MDEHPNWDRYYLDLAYTLVLDVLDDLEGEVGNFTYADLADQVKDIAQRDDGQCYKIYARHSDGRIDQSKRLNIVLTTMHKVKGLEFDSVVITPSYAPLPLRNELDNNAPLTPTDIEDIEEERRLLFVAYTRARKMLRVYKWRREFAVEAATRMRRADARMGYRDSEELDKLFLSYLATQTAFGRNAYVSEHLSRNDPLTLAPYVNGAGQIRCWVKHQDYRVASLSAGSRIVREISRNYQGQDLPLLSGVFVSDILVWTYEDSERYDREHGTNFSQNWCPEAIAQGFVYVVDFAGYAHESPVTVRQAPVIGAQAHDNTPVHGQDAMEMAQQRLQARRANRFVVGGMIPICGICASGRQSAVENLAAGAHIHFEREPDNSFDPNAVKALNERGEMVGYVARKFAKDLGDKMQQGLACIAEFDGNISAEHFGSSLLRIIQINQH